MKALALLLCAAVLVGCAGQGGRRASSALLKGDPVPPSFPHANFTLIDQHAKRVSLHQERGHYVIVTFLYSRCPDVCPLIAEHLNAVLTRLGPSRRRVRVLAVSVDPQSDRPAAVHHFIREHHLLPQFLYLTGTRAELSPCGTSTGMG